MAIVDSFLCGSFPSINDIYNVKTGKGLLMLELPLLASSPEASAARIGIIDSGIISNHPQLKSLVVASKSFTNTSSEDHLGHGTLVALQAIKGYRINSSKFPALISARVTNDEGVPNLTAVIEAIEWMAPQGVRVINLSLGFRGKPASYESLYESIARHRDIFFFAAAGNCGPKINVYPAAFDLPNLISVGSSIDGEIASYSGQASVYAPSDITLYEQWEYHLNRGNQAAQSKNYILAREEYLSSLLQRENWQAYFQDAALDVHAGELENGIRKLETALQLESEVAAIWSQLGAVRYMQGRYEESESLFRKALEKDPNEQMSAFNLGLTLGNLSRPNEALVLFQNLYQLNPEYPRLQEIVTELSGYLREG
jgi:hypothetical protein